MVGLKRLQSLNIQQCQSRELPYSNATRRGVSSKIRKMFKLSLDPSGTSQKKVPESVKKFYWDEFKVYVNYIQSIQMELDIIRKISYTFFVF